ncbi:MAG TPA: sugar phosphate nucleotidyltransferase [Byssovorax sp.]|jgi:mannose-1-phosphate guanylyltransferase
MTAGMILAAGLGTRLRPLTDELPKPLVWLGDRPLVAHAASRLAAAGVAPLVVNTHHLAGAFAAEVAALGLVAVHEPAILGTAGGVANARTALGDGEIVLWNGDLAADLDVEAMLAAHAASSALATLAVAPRAVGQGTVGLDARGAVVRLRGERFGDEVSGGDYLGAMVLGAELRAVLPSQGCLVGDALLPALRRGGLVRASAYTKPWHDVGTIGAYLAANLAWLAARGADSFVGPGARVAAGVEIARSIVGAGANVEGEGALERVIVWPGAHARAPLADAVVTPARVVAVPRETSSASAERL